MKRKALGKGLRSLIPDKPTKSTSPASAVEASRGPRTGLRQIDIDLIRPNPRQPRRQFDQEALANMAESMTSQGVIQPVLLRPVDDRFELVAGERRWRAAQLAGLHKIPAVVREVADQDLLEVALIENIQREELNPLDEAEAYRTLIDELGLTQDEVADRVGKSRATVANSIRLLGLARAVQNLIRDGKIGVGHAKALAAVREPTRQIRLAERIVRDGLSVRQSERLAARQAEALSVQRGKPSPARRDPNIVAAEEALQQALGTRARIFEGKKGGRIELYFASQEELSRVYDLILQGARSEVVAE